MTRRTAMHPAFGRAAKNGETDTCSICGRHIPEHHVPLILWDDSGDQMWVFCRLHEEAALAYLQPRQQP